MKQMGHVRTTAERRGAHSALAADLSTERCDLCVRSYVARASVDPCVTYEKCCMVARCVMEIFDFSEKLVMLCLEINHNVL